MKQTRATKRLLALLPLMVVGLLSFQNCSPAKFSTVSAAQGSPKNLGGLDANLPVPADDTGNADILLPADPLPSDPPPANHQADNDDDDDKKSPDDKCPNDRSPASETSSDTNDDKHSSDSQPGSMGHGNSQHDDSKHEPKKNREPDQTSSTPSMNCHAIAKSETQVVGNYTEVACGNSSDKKCALVCHVPPGNPAAKHNIVVGLPARLHAHKPGAHGGDYDGPCRDDQQTIDVCEAQ